MTAYNEVVSITKRFGLKCATLSFEMINLDTIKSIEIFSFLKGSSPAVMPFICPVWAFFVL